VQQYTVSGKKIPNIFDRNVKNYQILIIFDTNISDTTGDQIALQFFLPHPLSVSALPGETKPAKYCIFYPVLPVRVYPSSAKADIW